VTAEEFARRLHEATVRALACARELVVNEVPDEHRFDIVIKPHGPWEEGAPVDPPLMELWRRSRRGGVRELTASEVVAGLWHQGRVPEWIDIALSAIELPHDDRWRVVSFVELRCSRSVVGDEQLWYAADGLPPFHVLGPELPPGWCLRHTDAAGRFDAGGRRFLLRGRRER
jgi:hypothetical protein